MKNKKIIIEARAYELRAKREIRSPSDTSCANAGRVPGAAKGRLAQDLSERLMFSPSSRVEISRLPSQQGQGVRCKTTPSRLPGSIDRGWVVLSG